MQGLTTAASGAAEPQWSEMVRELRAIGATEYSIGQVGKRTVLDKPLKVVSHLLWILTQIGHQLCVASLKGDASCLPSRRQQNAITGKLLTPESANRQDACSSHSSRTKVWTM